MMRGLTGSSPVLAAWEHVNIQYLTKGADDDDDDDDVDGNTLPQTSELIQQLFRSGTMTIMTLCES